MAQISDPSREVLPSPPPAVCQTSGLIKTVKTNQFEEARNELRQDIPMDCSSVGCEAHIVSSGSEETDHEIQRRTSKTQLVIGCSSFKSNPNNMWVGVTSGLEEENKGVNVKGRFPGEGDRKKHAVENDDFSSSSAFESSPSEHRLENEKNTTKTIQLKVENSGGEEESRDDCLQEGMDTSQNDLLSTAEINSNSGSSASSGTQESFVHQSQGVSNHGCEGENGKTKPRCYLPGEKDLPVCDRDKDKEGDQDGCSQKKMDLDISQHDLLSSPGINSNSTSIAPKDNIKEDDQEGCCQEMMDLDIPQHDLFSSVDINGNSASSAPKDNVKEDDHEGGSQKKLEVENTEQCHGPSGGVEPSNALAKFGFTHSDLQHSCYCSNPSCSKVICNYVKAEVEHMKTHEDWADCSRCEYTRSVVQEHAKTCCLPGCRIPLCDTRRKGYGAKQNIAKPRPFKAPLVPMPLVHEPLMCSNFPQWVPRFDLNHVNGKVIFRMMWLLNKDKLLRTNPSGKGTLAWGFADFESSETPLGGHVPLNTNLMREDYFLEDTDYYVDKKALGKGSSGQVYLGCLRLDRSKKMAVKKTSYRIKKEEVEVYKLLGDHKHIVKHLGVTFCGNEGYADIFMELCGDSLFNYMTYTLKRRLSVQEAMSYWLQIREAVDYLHNLGIIHKDIKAKNVLMKKGRVLLADFDTAKRLVNEVTERGLECRGTEGFVSPEVLARAPHGRPVDIFGMGCFLIEMTIGPPINNTLKGKIEMLRDLDSELAELVEACVSKRPEHRPTIRSLLDWPVVKRYIAAGKAEVGRKENTYHWSQVQETSTTEDQTATLRTLENRAGENDLRRICELERIEAREL